MEALAFVNGATQIAVILIASLHVENTRQRRPVLVLAGASLAFSVAGLLLLMFPTLPDLSGLATMAIYIGVGIGMALGLRSAWRNPGAMRFMWRRGIYAQYRSQYRNYRRI